VGHRRSSHLDFIGLRNEVHGDLRDPLPVRINLETPIVRRKNFVVSGDTLWKILKMLVE
jgi:hypothetical protein